MISIDFCFCKQKNKRSTHELFILCHSLRQRIFPFIRWANKLSDEKYSTNIPSLFVFQFDSCTRHLYYDYYDFSSMGWGKTVHRTDMPWNDLHASGWRERKQTGTTTTIKRTKKKKETKSCICERIHAAAAAAAAWMDVCVLCVELRTESSSTLKRDVIISRFKQKSNGSKCHIEFYFLPQN